MKMSEVNIIISLGTRVTLLYVNIPILLNMHLASLWM